MRALVRGLAPTFEHSLKMEPAAQPINMAKAHQQHQAYVDLLKRLVAEVIELPADHAHPDCCFIEDTAVVAGQEAIVARIGAPERQGEEAPVAHALQQLGYDLKALHPPATLDGGDVLQLPGCSHILVGLSRRTNAAAVQQMQQHLPQYQVHGIPVDHGLHLKSAVTALDGSTLLFADTDTGRGLSKVLKDLPALNQGQVWEHVLVPDAVAANVLLIKDYVVMQQGCSASEQLLQRLCEERQLTLNKLPRMEEFIKADGALTCCSILLP